MTTIKLKNGSGAPTAGDLVQGEPALDLTNKRLYTEDSVGTVIEVGTNPGASGAVTLNYSGSAKLATTSTGIDVTGTASADQLNSNNGKLFLDDNGSHNGVINAPASLYVNFDSDNTSASEKIVFGYDRDGTSGGTSVMEINSTGIDVTGTAVTDGLTVDGATTLRNSDYTNALKINRDLDVTSVGAAGTQILFGAIYSGSDVYPIKLGGAVDTDGTAYNFDIRLDDTKHFEIASGGDISFYNDAGTSKDLYWDASTSRLGLGTTSPSNSLTVSSTAGTPALFERTGSTGAYIGLKDSSGSLVYLGDNNGTFEVQTAGSSYATKLAVTSAGNVGIGTTSPAGALHIHGGANGEQYISSSNSAMRFVSTGGINYIQSGTATSSSSAADLVFTNVGGSGETMRIDANGKVGIGTSTMGGASGALLTIGGSLSAAYTQFSVGASGGGVVGSEGNGLVFYGYSGNTGSETYTKRMTIDSSGDVIVGGTSSGANDAVSISNTGYIQAIVNGDTVGYFNRRTSDGEVIRLQKDGTTVGSIGAAGSTAYFTAPTAGGVRFTYLNSTNAALFPCNTSGANADALHNIGHSTVRFKDLYLSGGTYLGGTAAANHLDDYEEGTFTPAYAGVTTNPTVTHDIQSGFYTKIGRQVFCQLTIRTSAVSSQGSGQLKITGLPFAATNTSNQWGLVNVSFATGFGTDNAPISGYVTKNTSEINLLKPPTADIRDGLNTEVSAGALGTAGASNYLILSVMYTA